MTNSIGKAAIAAAIMGAFTIAIGASTDVNASSGDSVKCYGVAKAGQNDCGTATHGCSGAAEQDNLPGEWKYVSSASTCTNTGGSVGSPKE